MDVCEKDVLELIENAGVAADIEKIRSGETLADAGIDSLDLATVLLALEENYNIKIPDEDVEQLDTLAKMVGYLSSK